MFTVGDDLSRRLYRPELYAHELESLLEATRKGKATKPVPYLRWAHRLDGKEITTDEVCDLRAKGDETVWKRIESAHIWNHLPDNPFSPWRKVGTPHINLGCVSIDLDPDICEECTELVHDTSSDEDQCQKHRVA